MELLLEWDSVIETGDDVDKWCDDISFDVPPFLVIIQTWIYSNWIGTLSNVIWSVHKLVYIFLLHSYIDSATIEYNLAMDAIIWSYVCRPRYRLIAKCDFWCSTTNRIGEKARGLQSRRCDVTIYRYDRSTLTGSWMIFTEVTPPKSFSFALTRIFHMDERGIEFFRELAWVRESYNCTNQSNFECLTTIKQLRGATNELIMIFN